MEEVRNMIEINGRKLIKNYSTYIKESVKDNKFKVGDFAYYGGPGDDPIGMETKDVGFCLILVKGFNIAKKRWEYRISLNGHRFWVPEEDLRKAIKVDGEWKIPELEDEDVETKSGRGIRWYSGGKLSDIEETEDVSEYDDFITDDKFREFLIDNDAYDKYISNVKKFKPSFISEFNNIDKNYRSEIINYCFTWSGTPEGERYWNELNRKWGKYLRELLPKRPGEYYGD